MKEMLRNSFLGRYHVSPTHFIRCGGRFEILGNHTDHNHGKCIAATCSMSIFSAVKKRSDNIVNISSKDYRDIHLDISNLDINEKETGTSLALVRGVAKYLYDHNYKVGGFSAFSESTIFKGAGVSSSAAFECLVGQIFNELYNDNKIDKVTLAKAGQYAENVYYGKSCGLLDQIGVSSGGFVFIDFKDPEKPLVKPLHMDIKDHSFIIVNTGGDHGKMSSLYSQIPSDMKNVSKKLGVNYLRETTKENLLAHKNDLTNVLFLRASHFFDENERVDKAIEAIEKGDVNTLKEMMNLSKESSTHQLRNMMTNSYEGSPLEACDIVDKITNKRGACKINGGGFAGSIITLIPNDVKDIFVNIMKNKYGEKNVYLVNIDEKGVGDF